MSQKAFQGHFYLQKFCKFILRSVLAVVSDMFCPEYILITLINDFLDGLSHFALSV